MPEFPSAPIAPRTFIEEFVPEAFAAAARPEGSDLVSVRLGVRLDGAEGGEWVLHMEGGELRVEPGSRQEAAFTIVQTVEDWRGALWEGRGGVFGEVAGQLFRGQAPGPPAAAGAAVPGLALLDQLGALDGVIALIVTGGEGGDWRTAFKLGPGEIPEEPTTSISITAEDAAAMQTGELDPMQAFMAGKIQVAGDMALMMQIQAMAMQAQAAAQAARKGEG